MGISPPPPFSVSVSLFLYLSRTPSIDSDLLSLRSLSTPFYLNPPTFALLSRPKAVDPTQFRNLHNSSCLLTGVVAALPAFPLDILCILDGKVSKLKTRSHSRALQDCYHYVIKPEVHSSPSLSLSSLSPSLLSLSSLPPLLSLSLYLPHLSPSIPRS